MTITDFVHYIEDKNIISVNLLFESVQSAKNPYFIIFLCFLNFLL